MTSLVARGKCGFCLNSSMALLDFVTQALRLVTPDLVESAVRLFLLALIAGIGAFAIERLTKSRFFGFLAFWIFFVFLIYQVFIENQTWLTLASFMLVVFSAVIALFVRLFAAVFRRVR